MSTFITVVDIGSAADPYLAVQGCQDKGLLVASLFFNSAHNQPFVKSASDVNIGTKTITDTATGNTVSAQMFQLQANLSIDDAIKAPGCDHAVSLGFSAEVARFTEAWNQLSGEQVKLLQQKKKGPRKSQK